VGQFIVLGAVLAGKKVPDIIRQRSDLDLEFRFNGFDDIRFDGISQIDDQPPQSDRFSLLHQDLTLGVQRCFQLHLGDGATAFQRFADKQIVPGHLSTPEAGKQPLESFDKRFGP
jgi:hypothetical protein